MYEHVHGSERAAINLSRVSYAQHWDGQATVSLTYENDHRYILVCDDEAMALKAYGKIMRIMKEG